MRKKFINRIHHLSKEETKKLIKSDVDNVLFDRHCQEVADNLKIDKVIVKELLLDKSYEMLTLIQKKAGCGKLIKINIFGYFSFFINKYKTIKKK